MSAEDLDKAMNEGTVHGVVGDEKKAAASITPDENPGERKSMKSGSSPNKEE